MDNLNVQSIPISYLEKSFNEIALLQSEIIKLKLELADSNSILNLERKFDEIESRVYSGIKSVFRGH